MLTNLEPPFSVNQSRAGGHVVLVTELAKVIDSLPRVFAKRVRLQTSLRFMRDGSRKEHDPVVTSFDWFLVSCLVLQRARSLGESEVALTKRTMGRNIRLVASCVSPHDIGYAIREDSTCSDA